MFRDRKKIKPFSRDIDAWEEMDKASKGLASEFGGANILEGLRKFTFKDGSKPDGIIMLFTKNLITMIRLIQDSNAQEFLKLTDNELKNKYSDIEAVKEYLSKRTAAGKEGKTVKNYDEKVLRYPLWCLINSLKNIRKVAKVDIDMYVAEIYRATEYRYQNKDMNDVIEKKEVLDQIGKERRELEKRHKNEFMFIPPEIRENKRKKE
jgi:hypothetical protein